MKWNNLKNNKCPNCNEVLMEKPVNRFHYCVCGFTMSEQRFNEVLNSLYKKELRRTEEDNLEALNNLGHNLITEDFSDSPYADLP